MRYLTAGESHGPQLTAIIEGLPSQLPLGKGDIDPWLRKRQGGYGRGRRMVIETDEAEMGSSVSSLMSADDGSETMLSASQVLQHRLKRSGGAGTAAAPRLPTLSVRDDEGRPSALYVERTRLFRELIDYFNPELVEPRAELGGCIEAALSA